jgi:hypothetical protein
VTITLTTRKKWKKKIRMMRNKPMKMPKKVMKTQKRVTKARKKGIETQEEAMTTREFSEADCGGEYIRQIRKGQKRRGHMTRIGD